MSALHKRWIAAYRAARRSTEEQATEWRMEADYEVWPYLCVLALGCHARRGFAPIMSAVPFLIRVDRRWREPHLRAALGRQAERHPIEPRPVP